MSSGDLADVRYCKGPEKPAEFWERSEVGRRRQTDFFVSVESSVGCFPGGPCLNLVCTCLARTLLLPLESEVPWAVVV